MRRTGKMLLVLSFYLSITTGQAIAGPVKSLSFTQTKLEKIDIDPTKDQTEEYNTIASIDVEDITEEFLEENFVLSRRDKGLGEVIMTVEKLLALGKKIWAIIEAGRPVVSTEMGPAISVLPNIDGTGGTFNQMENWSAPRVRRYKVTYKNLFGMTVIGFTYTVYFQHSGSFQGAGAYLTGVDVEASDVEVMWGFEFNAASKLVTITNVGSIKDQVATATIKISYAAKSVLKEIRTSESFYVTGKGLIRKL